MKIILNTTNGDILNPVKTFEEGYKLKDYKIQWEGIKRFGYMGENGFGIIELEKGDTFLRYKNGSNLFYIIDATGKIFEGYFDEGDHSTDDKDYDARGLAYNINDFWVTLKKYDVIDFIREEY